MNKTDVINFRCSKEEKEQYANDAAQFGMNLSQYIHHLLRNREVRTIDGGRELAWEVYQLNKNLEKVLQKADVPIQDLKDIVSRGISTVRENIRKASEINVNS